MSQELFKKIYFSSEFYRISVSGVTDNEILSSKRNMDLSPEFHQRIIRRTESMAAVCSYAHTKIALRKAEQ